MDTMTTGPLKPRLLALVAQGLAAPTGLTVWRLHTEQEDEIAWTD